MAPGETCSDYMLAQMLQHEFDREHDAFLDKEEQHWNGSSKGMFYGYFKSKCYLFTQSYVPEVFEALHRLKKNLFRHQKAVCGRFC